VTQNVGEEHFALMVGSLENRKRNSLFKPINSSSGENTYIGAPTANRKNS
jgi:hypothetical protein